MNTEYSYRKSFRKQQAAPSLLIGMAGCLSFLIGLAAFSSSAEAQRLERSLNGDWQFQQEGDGDQWKTVTVPNSFEEHEGVEFDGVGIYQRSLEAFSIPDQEKAILRFDGSATHTEVWFDGHRLGEHIGGWTPFQFDVTELIKAKPDQPHVIRVRVDEKVGHNSQGFLPIIAPHFGGIWQDVTLLTVPKICIDDLGVLAFGDSDTGKVLLQLPVRGTPPQKRLNFFVRYRLLGEAPWSNQQAFAAEPDQQGLYSISAPIKDWKTWSPSTPNLYELQLQVSENESPPKTTQTKKPLTVRAAFRQVVVDGDRLLLNGNPLGVRGLLNWGYAPPRVSPSIDETFFRRELEVAKAYGFNLMKFCLWVPPKRYLEIADEMGMLTWIEYPTWHSKWTPDQLPTLKKEYDEFFKFDRNHPSVVLRSLTCETGPSADLEVIRTLYNMCHEMVPGSIVEDDSSWIQWNRVHDFYDDHPYGNNHTWVETLDRLKSHIEEHGVKPLVLGEAISADTWVDRSKLLEQVNQERPFWLPGFVDGNHEWAEKITQVAGPEGLEFIQAESKRYAFLMRKYQIETYRREVPNGGYVVSVIRDFPLASMGFIDYLDREKWDRKSWSWHHETMLLLKTENDRRSFSGGESLQGQILLSHFGDDPIQAADLSISIVINLDGETQTIYESGREAIDLASGELEQVFDITESLPLVEKPTQLTVRAELTANNKTWTNQWEVWAVPVSESPKQVAIHKSVANQGSKWTLENARPFENGSTDQLVVASQLDESLIDFMERGGRVMLLPDGEKGSLPLTSTWFLRGGPFVAKHALVEQIPRRMLIELQHFDLAGPVVPSIEYLEEISPIMLLWDNHDIEYVKTHGLVFETRVGQGRLLVSALKHDGDTNSAGKWILGRLLNHLANGPKPPRALAKQTVEKMRGKINEKKIELINNPWRFKPDPDNEGLMNDWMAVDEAVDKSWKSIKIGQHWEGQGYAALDGWAWYRIEVDIPNDWKGQTIYVSFEGVDDHYKLFVNGKLAGSGGVIETKETAFEERKSHDVTKLLIPGETNQIVVQVYDWHGAGGLFRPISIGTAKLGAGESILK